MQSRPIVVSLPGARKIVTKKLTNFLAIFELCTCLPRDPHAIDFQTIILQYAKDTKVFIAESYLLLCFYFFKLIIDFFESRLLEKSDPQLQLYSLHCLLKFRHESLIPYQTQVQL